MGDISQTQSVHIYTILLQEVFQAALLLTVTYKKHNKFLLRGLQTQKHVLNLPLEVNPYVGQFNNTVIAFYLFILFVLCL